MMRKVVRDGKVAVLVSHGFGAGWYSWNTDYPQCLFDPDIVALVEAGSGSEAIAEKASETYGDGFYPGGADGLAVEWVAEGLPFEIDEYDGAESLRLRDETPWMVA